MEQQIYLSIVVMRSRYKNSYKGIWAFFLSPPLDGAESLNRWLIIQLPMKSRFKVSKAIEREPQEFDTWGLRRA